MKFRMTKELTVSLSLVASETIKGNRELAESFGLDAARLDDPLYFQPSEDDYVLLPVRMLSATEVQSKTINFGHNGGKALQEATEAHMFDSLVILKNHDMRVENWLGKTQQTFWDTHTQGAPQGATGMMRLDKKSDPKVVRGLISGMLDSVSVTVGFDFEPSHPKMSDTDFYMHMGEVVDGHTVQANVTKINRVYELSVVWTGADQFAKVPGQDGAIHTPGVSHSQSFKEEIMDPKKLAALLGLSPDTTQEALEAHLKGAQAALTLQVTKATELGAKVTALETQVADLSAKHTTAVLELNTLTTDVVEPLKLEVATLKPQAEMGIAHFTEQKAEALRIYKLAVGDKAEESMTKLINEAKDLTTLAGFIKTFTEQANEVAPLHCQKCGSKDVGRKASSDKGHQSSDATLTNAFEAKRLEQTLSGMHRA